MVIPGVAQRFQVSQVSTQALFMQRAFYPCMNWLMVSKDNHEHPNSSSYSGRWMIFTYHKEQWLAEVLQRVDGIGGHRVCPRAPRQGEKPWLIDHIEVGGDVYLSICPLKDQKAIGFIKKGKEVSTSFALNQGETAIFCRKCLLWDLGKEQKGKSTSQ